MRMLNLREIRRSSTKKARTHASAGKLALKRAAQKAVRQLAKAVIMDDVNYPQVEHDPQHYSTLLEEYTEYCEREAFWRVRITKGSIGMNKRQIIKEWQYWNRLATELEKYPEVLAAAAAGKVG